jgi:hypothetical protein
MTKPDSSSQLQKEASEKEEKKRKAEDSLEEERSAKKRRTMDFDTWSTQLCEAVDKKTFSSEKLKKLLEVGKSHGFEIRKVEDKETKLPILHLAISEINNEAVELLIEYDKELCLVKFEGRTAAFFADKSLGSVEEAEEEIEEEIIDAMGAIDDTYTLFRRIIREEYNPAKDDGEFNSLAKRADLYTKDKFGNYVIHHAAESGEGWIISEILETFTDPIKRKKYLLLEDAEGLSSIDRALLAGYPKSLFGIKAIFEFLTRPEQLEFMKKIREEYEIDEGSFSEQDSFIEISELLDDIESGKLKTNDQRLKEAIKADTGYDSGDESLGFLEKIKKKTRFVARVEYDENQSPTLSLIPSDWRMETNQQGNKQGDHVIAYVLMLESLAYCKGENIKTLPKNFCDMACAIMPDHADEFVRSKEQVEKKLTEKREKRKETIANLKHVSNKEGDFLKPIDEALKKAETEDVARYIEAEADKLIKMINKIKGETFPNERKKGAMKLVKEEIKKKVKELYPNEKAFTAEFENAIEKFLKDTDKPAITKEKKEKIFAEISKVAKGKLPKELNTFAKINEFLDSITPLKKYHEGSVISKIILAEKKLGKGERSKISRQEDRSENLTEIGHNLAKLFDYPRTGKPDVIDDRVDDEYVLYEAIPRHLIMCFSAFRSLKNLTVTEKNQIVDSFLDKILDLQLWKGHIVKNNTKQDVPLNRDVLKERISLFASQDKSSGEFKMKSSEQFPERIYSAEREKIKTQKEEDKKKRDEKPSATIKKGSAKQVAQNMNLSASSK